MSSPSPHPERAGKGRDTELPLCIVAIFDVQCVTELMPSSFWKLHSYKYCTRSLQLFQLPHHALTHAVVAMDQAPEPYCQPVILTLYSSCLGFWTQDRIWRCLLLYFLWHFGFSLYHPKYFPFSLCTPSQSYTLILQICPCFFVFAQVIDLNTVLASTGLRTEAEDLTKVCTPGFHWSSWKTAL